MNWEAFFGTLFLIGSAIAIAFGLALAVTHESKWGPVCMAIGILTAATAAGILV